MFRPVRSPLPVAMVTLFLVVGCGGDGSGPTPTQVLAVHQGNNQTAVVARAVGVRPSVKVTAGSGSPVAGVTVTFAVASGGGTITGASATTGADGVAQVGGWTLGQVAGTNTLTAQLDGGGGSATFTATGTPDQPVTLAKVTGDNQTASTRATVPTPPAVRVADQFDNAVPGVSVTFAVTSGGGTVTGPTVATGPNGVATLGSWELGPTAGPNTVTVTAAGAGITNNPATFTATAQEVLFQPDQDVTLPGGTLQVTRLIIGAGRTVTVAGDLTIRVDSTAVIHGTLTGNCVAIVIEGAQDVTVTGTISNTCATPPENPGKLTIVALGGYDLTAGIITSLGDIDITNDPGLDDDDIPVAAARISGVAAFTTPMGTSGGICGVHSLSAPPAKDGTSGGAHGTNGKDGKTWTLRCRGDLSIGGTVAGQDGGTGGSGSDLTGTADASGGDGGDGGRLVVKATGIIGLGAGSTLRSGQGGHGGSATAMAQQSDAGTRAPSATAEGGHGGDPGLISVRAGAGIQVSGGATFALGNGGDGGPATAVGARGKDATASKAAQHGGHATARGGNGGSLDANRLRAFGNVLGGPIVTGGAGGAGANASAMAGQGGDSGIEAHPHGGDGGNISATGGTGGDADARNLQGNLFAPGGDGGAVGFAGGIGGFGWNGCSVSPPKTGGNGGAGGNGSGGDGAGGAGLPVGEAGGVTYTEVGNGGRAGDGDDPGTKGPAGSQAGVTVRKGPAVHNGTTFQDGAPGAPCGIPAGKGAVKVTHLALPSSGIPAVLAVIKQGATVVAQITSAVQTVILDPGLYELVSEEIDPDGFDFIAGVCAVDVAAPTSSPAADAPDPCVFSVVEAVLVEVVRTYVVQRALMNWGTLGLPPAVTVPLILQACAALADCNGVIENAVIPGAVYLVAGLWAALAADYFHPEGMVVERYRPLPLPVLSLIAAAVYNPVMTYYLFQRWYFYNAVAAVKLDPWGHALFVAMWAAAVIHLTREYPEPAPLLQATGEAQDVAITLTAPAPWVPLTGVLKPDGSITASGTGTVAGFPNVPVTFVGKLNANGTISGELKMGQDTPPTGLPQGSITYQIEGMPVAPPAPAASPSRR